MLLHPVRNEDILRAVVTSHTAGDAVFRRGFQKEVEDRTCAVVIVDA